MNSLIEIKKADKYLELIKQIITMYKRVEKNGMIELMMYCVKN